MHHSRAEWNLLVACDLPHVDAALFKILFEAAESCGRRALVPSSGARLEPLCAVYHRDLLPAVFSAISARSLKMHDFVAAIDACVWPAPDPSVFRNVNTPGDWAAVSAAEVRA